MSKHDVELAKVERSLELWRIFAWGIAVALTAVACSLPILALQGVIEPLAGKETRIDANVFVGVSLSASIAINGFQYLKGRAQRSEIQRLRDRATALEETLLNGEDH